MTKLKSSDKCCPKTPELAGLPPQFSAWRQDQQEFIERALDDSTRVTTICAPTGFGKQICTTAVALISKKPTAIVVPNRGLQSQYMSLGIPGMADLRGRKNYECVMRSDPDYSCEQGYAARCPYKGTHMCPSSQAEIRASISPIVITNYDKWTSSKRHGLGLGHIEQVIFDEGHEAFDALARAMQVNLHHKEIEETLEAPFLTGTDAEDMHEWKPWAIAVRAIAEQKTLDAMKRIAGEKDPKTSWVRHYTHMKNLTRRLGTLSTCQPKDWVVEQTNDGYIFDPIRPGKYCESALLMRTPKVIAVSATIRPKTMFMCGIGGVNFTFKEFDSSFDPSRCPIYWIPTMPVEYGKDLTPLWNRFEQIAARRIGLKGIVHTVSYTRQQDLYNYSRFSECMITNDKGDAPTDKVDLFKSLQPPAILVSPSVGTGYDFPDDQCRWQFICKVPFEPPSKIQRARQEDDPEYTYYRAMQYLVQAFGRDMRSKDDWSERFIADDHFKWFRRKYAHLAPKSFHAVYKQATVVPPPLKIK